MLRQRRLLGTLAAGLWIASAGWVDAQEPVTRLDGEFHVTWRAAATPGDASPPAELIPPWRAPSHRPPTPEFLQGGSPTPQPAQSRYRILVVSPDPSVDYKILVVRPDPSVDYKIRIVNPEAGRPRRTWSPAPSLPEDPGRR